MEYRRRRIRKSTALGGALRALSVLLIFGAAVYLIVGTGVGRKLKEGYALSLLDSCAEGKVSPSPSSSVYVPSTSDSEQNTDMPEPLPTGKTEEAVLHSIDLYMIRFGIYESESQCEQAAAELKSMGAAGFSYIEDDRYYLIAASYSDETSAQSVLNRLKYDGYDCVIVDVHKPSVPLLITASEDRLEALETAFTYSYEVITRLDELAIAFDRDDMSVENAQRELSELISNCRSALSGVSDIASLSRMMEIMEQYYMDVCSMLEGCSVSAANKTELSSMLKSVRTEAALKYCGLLEDIGG